jgi:phage baseplate assembly protein W
VSAARNRAWRFNVPRLDVGAGASGLGYSPTGGVAMIEEDASVRQAILLLINTQPGERVMRPAYGCRLAMLAFSPSDDTTAGLAIHYVRTALERWEPRIDILRIDAERNPDMPERLDVVLEYRVRATQHVDRLTMPFDLEAGAIA